jgi:hypothetical protein
LRALDRKERDEMEKILSDAQRAGLTELREANKGAGSAFRLQGAC